MTALHATAIDELCHTLGLRTPIGVMAGLHLEPHTASADTYSDSENEQLAAPGAAFTDEQLTALGVLAQPDAIAVVTQWPAPQPFAAPVPTVRVLATRGPWLAEHVIEGDAHHLHAADADNAALLLLDRCGFVEPDHSTTAAAIDVSLSSYRRMTELVRAGDRRRAVAALVADGANPAVATALVYAVAVGRVDVAGLGADGHRFVGCDLAVAGDASTGRWIVPAAHHVDAAPKHAYRHPSCAGLDAFGASSGNLRVIVERVGTDALHDELALIFGAV
ncbi:MAG: hypothetical protein QOJ00_2419 [Actinomycetota bacterium]|jgi:hypothetical protein